MHLIWDGNTTRFRSQSYATPPDDQHDRPRRVMAPTRMRVAERNDDDSDA